jgi:exosome complex exonuclease DIS3/RRP44
MNRSIDGDIVVVELLPKSEWESSSTVFVDVDAPDVDALDNMSFSNTQKEKSMTEGVSDEAINPTRPTGRVVGVVRKAWRPYSGTIEVPATGSAKGGLYFFVPLNRRVPKIKIQSRQPDRFRNKRVVVCIDGWGTNSKYPYGHYVRVIGDVGDKSAESEALLVQHDIRIAPFDAVRPFFASDPRRGTSPTNMPREIECSG